MASRTIHTLSYKLIADTRQLTPGLILGKKEVNLLKRDMSSSVTPIQRMKARLDELGEVVKKDTRFQELYNHKLREYNTALKAQGNANRAAGKSFSGLKSRIAGAAAAYLSFHTVMAAGRGIQRTIDRLDQLSKSARAFGVSTEFLTRFQFAAASESGLSEQATTTAIQRMQRRISEAAIGTGEAQGALKELGLDAKALAASGGEAAMMALADAFEQVTSKQDALRLSTKFFDTEAAKLGLTLMQGSAAITAQGVIADKLGRTLKTVDGLKAEQAAQALKELGLAVGGVAQSIITELLPAIEGITKGLRKVPGFFDKAGMGIEAIGRTGRTVPGFLGDLFGSNGSIRNPMAEFQRNLVTTIGERGGQDQAAVTLAKTNQRLKALQDAKEATKQKQIDDVKELKLKKEDDKKTVDVYKSFFTGIGPAILNEMKIQGDMGLGFQPRATGATEANLFGGLGTKASDPMASIAAGSSEAFKILNRTAGTDTEKQLAKTRTKNSELTVKTLASIDQKLTATEPQDILS